MKPQQLVMLIVAIGCGLAAMVLTQRFLAAGNKPEEDGDLVPVVVAKLDLNPGDVIGELMVQEVRRDRETLPASPDGTPLPTLADVKERAVRFPIVANEVVTESKLAPKGYRGGINAVIEKGKRATTVSIETGFVEPDSHVDVILITQGHSGVPPRTETILQNVKVIATDWRVQKDPENPEGEGKQVERVTFLLDPDDSQRLLLAESEGKLRLTLRACDDQEQIEITGLDVDDLYGRFDHPEYAETPDSVFLEEDEKDVAKAPKPKSVPQSSEPPALERLLSMASSVVDRVMTPAPPQPKKLKKVVLRDIQGEEVMTVVLEADSEYVASLGELAVDVRADEYTEFTGEELPQPAQTVNAQPAPVPSQQPESFFDFDEEIVPLDD